MNRRSWFKTSLGLMAATSVSQSLKADEVKYRNRVNPNTGRWMTENAAVGIKAKLNSNENPFGPSDKAKAAFIDGLKDANRYSFAQGQLLKEKIAKYEGVQANQIFLGAGLSEMLTLLGSLQGLLHGELISAHPTFDLMPGIAASLGGKWIKIPLNANYEHDLKAMEAAMTPNTKMMYICNPGNPCPTVVDPLELKSFVDRVSKKTLVFIDEAYNDYIPDRTKHSMISMAGQPNVLIGKTLSKIHGFAGIRVAYTISSPDFVKEIEKYHTWNFSISAPALQGALTTIDDETFKTYCVDKTLANREYTVQALKLMGYKPLPSYTNFIIFPIQKDGNELVNNMANKGIALRSWNFDNKNWCRVSIGTHEEMEMYIEAMKAV